MTRADRHLDGRADDRRRRALRAALRRPHRRGARIYNRALSANTSCKHEFYETRGRRRRRARAGQRERHEPAVGARRGFRRRRVSASQINLAWTGSTDNVAVANYRVERCQGATCTTFVQVATPTGTTYNDIGLTTATTYRYRVRAADAAGNFSGYTAIQNATTPDTQAPTAPTGLTASRRLCEPDRPCLDGVDRQCRGHGLQRRALRGRCLHQLPRDRNPDRADVLGHWACGGDDVSLPRSSCRRCRQPERLLRDPERGDDGHPAAH